MRPPWSCTIGGAVAIVNGGGIGGRRRWKRGVWEATGRGLKDMVEKLPAESYDFDSIRIPNGLESICIPQHPDTNEDNQSKSNMVNLISPIDTSSPASTLGPTETMELRKISDGNDGYSDSRSLNGGEGSGVDLGNKYLSDHVFAQERANNEFNSRKPASYNGDHTINAPDQVEAEWNEQYEPGVYLTLVSLRDGTRDLKKVRFSRRRFGEHQAETWWSENREKVYDKYNVNGSERSSVSTQTTLRTAESLPSYAHY
ncbi:hypothetical protein E3N88_15271 [Mikania micrantha]|uniref:BRX domain-containing protein n=1 Tax=Mikania micrantha TaxID=192012 RepID=A0A5N6NWS9_9ASTR|nr:hypothetical protein E3N88_15271 [Mikania micrantha]